MRLSMWMIVNRLYHFELEVHVRDQSPIYLRSARRVYATNCVYVYQSGEDSICKSGEDYFIMKDMDVQSAVEIVQSVFDYYDDWEMMIRNAIVKMDFQKVIDKSWHIFHNPIVLMDGNWNAVALSSRYKDGELDEEWNHLCRYGSVSLDVYNHLKNDKVNNFEIEGACYYRMSNPQISNCISSLILHNSIICGRINVLEVNRELNQGDIQMLNYLVEMISLAMALFEEQKNSNQFCSIYHTLLEGNAVEEERLYQQMAYRNWNNETDYFYIIAACPLQQIEDKHEVLLFKNQLSRLLPECEVDVFHQDIVVLTKSDYEIEDAIKKISALDKLGRYVLGKSLKFKDMHLCRAYYRQAVFAVRTGMLDHAPKLHSVYDFYDYAIDFIILNSSSQEGILACHPDIIKLENSDSEIDSNRVKTLMVYLQNERSLIRAAKELFVHRNTLVYRLNKIFELLESNLDDAYTRDYMMLSSRILKIYRQTDKLQMLND